MLRMMPTLLIALLLAQGLAHPSWSQDFTNLVQEQQKLVGDLCGHHEVLGGQRINSRSRSHQRELAREYMAQSLEKLGLKPQRQSYALPNILPIIDLFFSPFTGANVYATLPATVPSKEYIVLGAHFDTERDCPGAIDNATGMAICYSTLQYLAKLPYRSKHVIVVFFDQEEEDLIGSQAFAQKLKQEGTTVHSVHTFDTMGWDRDHDLAIELELPTPELEALYRQQGEALGIPIYTTRVNSTDHHSFRELGFHATGLTDEYAGGDYAPYKDTPQDTFDTVNFAYLASCTQLVYHVVQSIITNPQE